MTGIESLARIQDRTYVDNIKEMTECFVSQLDPLKVILFGSFADGSYTDESDYDFYIVVIPPGTVLLCLSPVSLSYS